MSTSYETLELIASHHAEVERLCEELLDLGSRIKPGDPELYVLRENARALAWRLREHLAIESSALMADAGANPAYEKALLVYRNERERLDRAWADAEKRSHAPLELVNAVCTIARDARAHVDRAVMVA